ncbi:hypothetical protein GCM10009687_01790 [Asanoa iriomotensis]|uniref:Tetratricopeptide repeat protein n=1 Tax=Asanoa iriomotensis TaxID=234613 RepID=A0ABQ4BZ38_9ACTN|nr:hypothetical protein Air01nite_18970 [Asanoa iriomotensis]
MLDNARDADQVRDLIPGAAGCAVVVTSRNRLPALVATAGARPFPLDLLPAESARALFLARAGGRVTARDDPALAQIVARCAGLPLALALVAARAATRPNLALRVLADDLAGVHNGLDGLTGTDLRPVFSWSYLALDEPERRMFRLLGLFPGTAVGVAAAASLAGAPAASAGRSLAKLAEANMVTELADGRFTTHDLLRAYACELVAKEEAASRRLVDHYVHSAETADKLLWPHRHRRTAPAPPDGVSVADLGDQEGATAWLVAEQPVLLALLDSPVIDDPTTARLARALTTHLHRSMQPGLVHTVATAALRATERSGDDWGRADAQREIGLALIRLDRHAEATGALDAALALFEGLDEYVGMAHTQLTLGWLADQQLRLTQSLEHDRRALALFGAAGDRNGEARALNAVGWDEARLGNHAQALRQCRRAVRLHLRLGDRSGAARAHDSIGYALHHLGRYSDALDSFDRALAVYRAAGDLFCVAETLTHVGDTLHAGGSPGEASAAWRAALGILDTLGHATRPRSGNGCSTSARTERPRSAGDGFRRPCRRRPRCRTGAGRRRSRSGRRRPAARSSTR